MADIDVSWDQWKVGLKQALEMGKKAGLSDQQIVDKAAQIGDFLARNVDPSNPQNRLLKELWTSANEQEQKAIASAVVKMLES
ncbi:MAG: DUF3243 domain-containing protein [Limnochordales bacterium]|nr:DUF3243 domain-containing protein [Limnochordales bacterium]